MKYLKKYFQKQTVADLSKDWEEDNDGSAGEGDAEETIESIVNFIQVKLNFILKLNFFIFAKRWKICY